MVRQLTGLPYPVRFLVAVEVIERYHRLAVFAAHLVRDFPKPDVVADMIFKIESSLTGNGYRDTGRSVCKDTRFVLQR